MSRTSTANAVSNNNALETYNWRKDSDLYKGLGWGFFGSGLLIGVAGTIVTLTAIDNYNEVTREENFSTSNRDKYQTQMNWGNAVMAIGAAFTITGIGLLIAEAVKFGPYRRGEVAGDFTWHPEFYVTPEMSGFGISGRF